MNFYELFDLKPQPIFDKKLIQQKYFALQKQYHPDFNTIDNNVDKQDVLKRSAAINTAYKTFSNMDEAIAYFLRSHNQLDGDEKKALTNDFLMAVMEINEAIDMGVAKSSIEKNIADIMGSIEHSIQPILHKIATDFTAVDFKNLKNYYYKKKYLQRVLDRLEE